MSDNTPVPDNPTEPLPRKPIDVSANPVPDDLVQNEIRAIRQLVLDDIRSTHVSWILTEAAKIPIDFAAEAKSLWNQYDKRIGAPPDIGEVTDQQQARAALRLLENALTTLPAGDNPTASEPPADESTTDPGTPTSGENDGVKRRLSKEESNILVKDYLTKNKARAAKGEVSIREVNQATGVAQSSICRTSSWRAYQEELDKMGLSKKTIRRKAQAYTSDMDAVVGQDDTDDNLHDLIKEQMSDYEPSPLEPDKGHRSKIRVKKKI